MPGAGRCRPRTDKKEEWTQSASDACGSSNEKEESGGTCYQRRRGAIQKRVRALTAEVVTLKLSLRTLQESYEAREAKRRKRRGILARKKKRTIKKSEENANDMLITPEIGGKIVLSVFQKGKDHINHISAGIEECGIKPPINVDSMKWKEVVDLL